MCVGAMLNTSSQFSHDSADQAAKTRGVAQIAAIWRAGWPMMGCMGWVDCAATCIHALSNKSGAQDPVSHQVAVGQDRMCLRHGWGTTRLRGGESRDSFDLLPGSCPAPHLLPTRFLRVSSLRHWQFLFARLAKAGVNCFLSKQSHLRKGIPGGNHHIRCGTNCARAKRT